MCKLLRAFPGWEAIKTTRGHYRSCGKDPHMCCVSDLLDDAAVVQTGRELTYAPGKDTGRYWDAGATNVHWVVATDEQVEAGINDAIGRVQAPGVFIEGNSFAKFLQPDYFVMVARTDELKIKRTARELLKSVSAFYVSDMNGVGKKESLGAYLRQQEREMGLREVPVLTENDLPGLIASIGECFSSLAA
jgi:hypothetical protein